jgi:5-methylcytosine-specific restriction endonuclease McrBC GTP-binding regulatory subunit McrB
VERVPYSLSHALDGLFMRQEEFERLLRIWRQKRNLVIQGAPGVGKSFVARRLAYSLVGYEDPSRVQMIQFHQSYSYEDFVQGFRPDGTGAFVLRDGIFVEFCNRALEDGGETYVLIIDEINRGNLSKILGELMLLIESDKRSAKWAVQLAYADDTAPKFHVPHNVFLLGLMNTADRSLAVVDYALRRRFAFATLRPAFTEATFREHLVEAGAPSELVQRIIDRMSQLNSKIEADLANLGPGFCIGHSFFIPTDDETVLDEDWYRQIVESEIVPLLQEYWYDDQSEVKRWQQALLG